MPKPFVTLIVGHTQKKPGAKAIAPLSIHEYEYNKDLAFMIAELIDSDFDCKVIFRDGRSIDQTYDLIKDINPDASIELHFNSAETPLAYGTETICTSRWIAFAMIVQTAMCEALSRDTKGNRGLKVLQYEYERGWSSVSRLDVPNVLVEPFFGSNLGDVHLGLDHKMDIAKAIRNALWTWFIYDDGSPEC